MSAERKECMTHAPNIGTSAGEGHEAKHLQKDKADSIASVSRPTTPDGNDSSEEASVQGKSRHEDPVASISGTETDDDTQSDASTQSSSCLVIVNYVPDSWTEARLRHQFKPFNPTSVKLVMDRHTGKTQGYGFVQFRSPEDTSRAIASLNGLPVSGKRLKVTLAKPREEARLNTNIYVSGLPPDPYCTDVYLHGLCSVHGTVLELKLLREAAIRGSHQTLSAFVRFRRRQESDAAIANLNGAVVRPPGTDKTWTLSARYATDARTRSKESAGVWISDSLSQSSRQNADRNSVRRPPPEERPRGRNNHARDGGRRTHNRPVNPWHTPPTIGNVEVGKVKDSVANVTMEEPDFVTPLKPTRTRNGDAAVTAIATGTANTIATTAVGTAATHKPRTSQSSSASYREQEVSLLSSGGPPSVMSVYSHQSHHSRLTRALSATDLSPNSSVWSAPGSHPASARWGHAVSPSDTGFYPTPPGQPLPIPSYPLDAPFQMTHPMYPPRQYQDFPPQHAPQTQGYSPEYERNAPQPLPPHPAFRGTAGTYFPQFPPESQHQQFMPYGDVEYPPGAFHPDPATTSRRHYSFSANPPVAENLAPPSQTPGLSTQSVPFPIAATSAFPTNAYLDHDHGPLWDNRYPEGVYNPDWPLDPLGDTAFGSFVSQKLHAPTLDDMKATSSRGDDANDLDNTFDLDALLSELPLDSEDMNSPRSNKLDAPNQTWNTSI